MKKFSLILLAVMLAAGMAFANNWELQEEFPGDIDFGIDFLNTETGWIAGGSNLWGGPVIYRTDNGGDNWTLQTAEMFTMQYLDIDMADDQVGYAGGLAMFGLIGPGAYTTNGGATWKQLNLGFGLAQAWQDVFTLDRNHSWLTGFWASLFGGEHSGVARTTDMGASWKKLDWGIADSPRYSWFIDASEGWCAGGHWPDEEKNDGKYYRFEKDPLPVELPAGFPEFNEGMDYTDYHGVIAHTTDGGKNWTLLYESNQVYFNEIQFLNRNEGWVVGESWLNDIPFSVVMHTMDGGHTWEVKYSSNQHGLTGIDFVDSDHGFATGMASGAFNPQPRIVRTTDGGETWTLDVITVGYGTMYSSFPTAYEGWSIGANNYNNSGLFHYYDPSGVPNLDITVSDYPSSAMAGDTVRWYVGVHNLSDQSVTFDLWLSVTGDALPPGYNPYTVLLAEDLTVPAGFNGGGYVEVALPDQTPTGDYTFDTIAGNYPETEMDSDSFELTVY